MLVPDSFAVAYEAELATAEEVRRFAGQRLRVLCAEENWLFDERIKTAESTLVKLETGRCESLSGLVDFYATMVVVPTFRYVKTAVERVLGLFDGVVKPQRTRDPQAFPYDDVHVTARLGTKVTAPAMPEAVRQRPFEIQVRTGLQYAWWRAAHDTTYKGAVKEWSSQRLASQARAALELLDGVLTDIPQSAALQKPPNPAGDPEPHPAAAWLDRWPEGERPDDVARFCETVDAVAGAAGVPLDDVAGRLADGSYDELLVSRTLTPAQTVTVVVNGLATMGWTARMADQGLRLLVTDEMIRADPSLAAVPDDHRVRLS